MTDEEKKDIEAIIRRKCSILRAAGVAQSEIIENEIIYMSRSARSV